MRELLTVLACVLLLQWPSTPATAAFSAGVSAPASITAATLLAPTAVSLTGNGNALGCLGVLSWVVPSGSVATEWEVQRYRAGSPDGSPQSVVGNVNTLTDSTVSLLVPYTWKVHAKVGNWVSPDTTISKTLTSGCL